MRWASMKYGDSRLDEGRQTVAATDAIGPFSQILMCPHPQDVIPHILTGRKERLEVVRDILCLHQVNDNRDVFRSHLA